jgi:hypothetical protein
VRVYTGTRELPKTHIAGMRIAGPATEETWVGDADGDPVMVITAAPSQSLAAELARLLPDLRAIVGPGRACTVIFDRGGYSPAVFTEIISAGFDVLTYFKGAWARAATTALNTVHYKAPDGAAHTYDLAERLIDLPVPAPSRRAGRETGIYADIAADRAAQPRRAPDPDPYQPHRPGRRADRLPNGRALATGELLQIRPGTLRPLRPGSTIRPTTSSIWAIGALAGNCDRRNSRGRASRDLSKAGRAELVVRPRLRPGPFGQTGHRLPQRRCLQHPGPRMRPRRTGQGWPCWGAHQATPPFGAQNGVVHAQVRPFDGRYEARQPMVPRSAGYTIGHCCGCRWASMSSPRVEAASSALDGSPALGAVRRGWSTVKEAGAW